ncbi:hypothetical protein [Streptomyces sp. NPDC013187]|uniref:hypothetical protein n=1 Tax=Streptomyces sp. NPDC013187 TaxID=3364865 RepID=UPI0036C7D30D
MQTYVKRDGLGLTEVRPISEPMTHEGTALDSLIGRLVMVRPFYHVPNGRSSLKSVRSAYAYEARVVERFSDEMVKVQYTWASDGTPWKREAVFFARELHQVHICECAACKGRGIFNQHQGA